MRTILSRSRFVGLLSAALASPALSTDAPLASNSDLEQLIGHPASIKRVIWAVLEPPQTNLWVFQVQSQQCDEARLTALATAFAVKGEVKPMPQDMTTSGFWIKETNPTNTHLWRSITWSKTGMLAYYSGDDGYRWDVKNHKPLVEGVPDHKEAIRKALALLPVLGLTTNDLEVNSSGSLRVQFAKESTGYNERGSKERKEVVNKRAVLFFQRVPGGETLSVGEGGTLQMGFVSGGKVADIELLFRDLRPVGTIKSLTAGQIQNAFERGRVWTYRNNIPETLTITNCTLVYPQGNSSYSQKYVWPVYALTGFGNTSEGIKTFSFFLPLNP